MPETTTATITEAKSVSFGPIDFDESDAGKTYTYTISEDGFGTGWIGSGDVTATVVVKDNGDGKLTAEVTYSPENATITNTYKAEGEVVLEAIKELTGREWKAGEKYTFTLLGPNGEKIEEKTVDANGKIAFTTIKYTEADAGKTYEYTISETSTLPQGVTKSDDIKATVTITDNGNGTLKTEVEYTHNDTIINTYTAEPVKAQVNVLKNIEGYIEGEDPNGKIVDRTFNFTMTGPKIEGALTTSITTSGGTGTASFDMIEYTFDDMKDADGKRVTEKQFTYEVTETAESVPGWTFDPNTYEVVVTVEDDQEGHLSVTDITKVDAKNNVQIINTFKEVEYVVELNLEKVIEDQSGSAQDTTFTFVLLDKDKKEVQRKTVTTENLKGSVNFDKLTFE